MLLKSQGIENLSVDKLLSIVKEADKEKNTKTLNASDDIFPVGGTIFYIDDDDDVDGKYEFFDVKGNPIKKVRVGDRPYAYRVIEKGQYDMYYVYHDEVYDNLRWTYYKDKKYVYKFLCTLDKIGSGKTNTEIVMTKDNGAYISKNSKGYPTIWYQLKQVRNDKIGGCDDWFVPSKSEVVKLMEAIKSGIISGGTIAGSSYTESVFSNKWFWSSSEFSSQCAWIWYYYSQYWHDYYKLNYNSVFFIRAF